MQGRLPRSARALVTQWAAARQQDLRQNWDLAQAGQPLNQIEPLD